MSVTGFAINPMFEGGASKPQQNLKLIKQVFLGQTDKTTVHGTATVKHIAGLIHTVHNVLLPDGSRSDEIYRGMPEAEDWFYRKSNGECVYGHIRVRDDDVVFVTRIDQPKPFVFPANSLPGQLIGSTNACEMARDDDFALKLFGALCATAWLQSGRRWQGSWEKAARTVAEMRGLNEPYSEFLLSDCCEDEFEHDDVLELLESLGWVPDHIDDTTRRNSKTAKQKRAFALLDECERQPTGPVPEWYMKRIMALNYGDPKQPLVRLNWAAFSGQMSFQDYVKFFELHDFSFDEDD